MYICYDTQGKFLYRPPICRISDAYVLGFRCLADGSHVQCKRKLSILCIKDTMRKMIPYIYPHQRFCIFFGLWSGIAGIVALAVNDVSECAESYQKLRLVGIVLSAFSVCFFINCFILKRLYGVPVVLSSIFVFVLDCMLINDIVRGNESDDCSGARGTPRLFMIWWSVPLAVIGGLSLIHI